MNKYAIVCKQKFLRAEVKSGGYLILHDPTRLLGEDQLARFGTYREYE